MKFINNIVNNFLPNILHSINYIVFLIKYYDLIKINEKNI